MEDNEKGNIESALKLLWLPCLHLPVYESYSALQRNIHKVQYTVTYNGYN
jgi:hypothetical protein